METHRGEIVQMQITRSGIKKQMIAEKLKITRQTLDNWLKRSDLEWDKIMDIGKILRVNFVEIFTAANLSMIDVPNMDDMESGFSIKEQLEICKKERDDLKEKYIKLLEDFNLVMRLKRHQNS